MSSEWQRKMDELTRELTEGVSFDIGIIADRLLAAGCFGEMGDPHECSLALWYSRGLGLPSDGDCEITVSHSRASLNCLNRGSDGRLAQPLLVEEASICLRDTPLSEFVTRFDRGLFLPLVRTGVLA